MSSENDTLDGWITYCAELLVDLRRAGILDNLDNLTDEEIDNALEKMRDPDYNRASVMQTPRVIPEKSPSNVGLVSAL